MTQPLIVFGAGGFGRETLDIAEAMNAAAGTSAVPFDILGVVDDMPADVNLRRLEERGIPYLGTSDQFLATGHRARFAVGVGSCGVRRRIAQTLTVGGLEPIALVHPSVTQGARIQIGGGAVVCAGVRLTTNIVIGEHVHLNLNTTVGHDVVVGAYTTVNPAVSISGDCTIGAEVMLGCGAVILEKRQVGDGAVVGANACVVKDVPDGVTVKGVPAR